MTFRDLKFFGARLSDLSRTLAGDLQTRLSDLKFKTLNGELPVLRLRLTYLLADLHTYVLVRTEQTRQITFYFDNNPTAISVCDKGSGR